MGHPPLDAVDLATAIEKESGIFKLFRSLRMLSKMKLLLATSKSFKAQAASGPPELNMLLKIALHDG